MSTVTELWVNRENYRETRITGAQAAADIWEAMLDNQVSPKRGIIVSISGEG